MGNLSFGNVPSIFFEVSQKQLWFAFLIILSAFFIMSLVLMYHWNKYGMKSKGIILAKVIYFVGSAVILIGAFSIILTF
jgi:fucose permease